MSTRSILAMLCVFFCVATITSGCKKGCPTCRAYGYIPALGTYVSEVCTNRTCYCPNGLEGDSCQLLSLIKYLQPSMTYNSGTTAYSNVFFINGLFGGGATVEADILSNTSHQGINLNIPSQITPSGTINSGSGFYQSNGTTGKITLNLDYTSNNTGIETNCTLILYQQ
jgi:hypothetical protein